MECNFLLVACPACSRMPRHLHVESGFAEEILMSSLGEESCNKIESQVVAIVSDRKGIAAALEEAVLCLKLCLKKKQEDPVNASI